ncbi:hypothetical protein K449DRAFT_385331 [Hypoxylon sp. EC38]|nr:hypothetical protein K449DRAFT_385331 [Hypoxylon sp. EC38]
MKAIFDPLALVFSLWLPQTALAKTGNITLFSDTHCKEPVYINSFILGIDTCGKEDSATPYRDPFRSFILNERPWCRSGARPEFSIYSDSTCLDMIASNLPDPLVEEEGNHPCVVPGDFKGMAFICDGLDGVEGPLGDVPTSAETTVTEVASTASEAVPTATSAVITEDSSTSTIPSTPTTATSSTTPSSVSTSSVSESTAGSSSATNVSPASPVPTSRAATITGRTLFMRIGVCLLFLVTTM